MSGIHETTCCDEVTLELYRMGLLEEPAAEGVRLHLQGCPACQDRLAALDLEDLRLEAALNLTDEERDRLMDADLPDRLAAQISQSRRMGWFLGGGLLTVAAGAAVGLQTLVLPWLHRSPLGAAVAGERLGAELADRLVTLVSQLLWPSDAENPFAVVVPLVVAGLVIIILNLRHRRPRRFFQHR